jgi:hypothetical protein
MSKITVVFFFIAVASYYSCFGFSGVSLAGNRADCLRSTSGVLIRSCIDRHRLYLLVAICSPQTEPPIYE